MPRPDSTTFAPTPMRARQSVRPLQAGAALVAFLLGGCGPGRIAVIGPAPNPDESARLLMASSRVGEPIQVLFDWAMNEAGVRMSGRGVARIEPPYKARLDLFLGNGETVARAALVDGELRLPAGATREILPPADLMWGALGVFRPQDGTRLLGGDRLEGERLRLRYGYEDGRELHFQMRGGGLERLELLQGARVVAWVDVSSADGSRYPEEATYRDLAEYRELRIRRRSLDVVAPFPADIWDPNG